MRKVNLTLPRFISSKGTNPISARPVYQEVRSAPNSIKI